MHAKTTDLFHVSFTHLPLYVAIFGAIDLFTSGLYVYIIDVYWHMTDYRRPLIWR